MERAVDALNFSLQISLSLICFNWIGIAVLMESYQLQIIAKRNLSEFDYYMDSLFVITIGNFFMAGMLALGWRLYNYNYLTYNKP